MKNLLTLLFISFSVAGFSQPMRGDTLVVNKSTGEVEKIIKPKFTTKDTLYNLDEYDVREYFRRKEAKEKADAEFGEWFMFKVKGINIETVTNHKYIEVPGTPGQMRITRRVENKTKQK